MTHIDFNGRPRCSAELKAEDKLTETALASDCDTCRGAVAIAPMGCTPTGALKPLGVHPVPTEYGEPHPQADEILAYVARRRSE